MLQSKYQMSNGLYGQSIKEPPSDGPDTRYQEPRRKERSDSQPHPCTRAHVATSQVFQLVPDEQTPGSLAMDLGPIFRIGLCVQILNLCLPEFAALHKELSPLTEDLTLYQKQGRKPTRKSE
jgi:hypothetical protein